MHEVRGLEDGLGAVRYWEEDYGRTVVLELPKFRPGQRLVIANLDDCARVIIDEYLELFSGERFELTDSSSELLLLCGTGL